MNVLLLRLVKAKAQNQGKAKPRVLPMLILQTKAKRAKKAKKARRVKKVPTPKATRAKKDRRAHTPGPSWKVARVQPKGTQNDGFSPSFLPLPPVSVFHFHPPWLLGRTCLWRTVSDSISGAENCTVTRRSSAHWPVMSEGSKHVCSINCCIRSWLDIFPPV